MKEKQQIVYLKADRNSVCHDPKIKIQDVMSVQCADPAICAGIKNKTRYLYTENLMFRYRKVSMDQKLRLQIPLFWEKRYLET